MPYEQWECGKRFRFVILDVATVSLKLLAGSNEKRTGGGKIISVFFYTPRSNFKPSNSHLSAFLKLHKDKAEELFKIHLISASLVLKCGLNHI